MSKSQWIRFGEVDPYFGVCASEKYHGTLTAESKEEFFQSGEEHVADLFDHFANFHPNRTLDFGCGVGRLTVALAKRSGSVLGVDVSPGMLKQAKINCAHLGNVELGTSIHGKFDFVHSYIVFQHIPPNQGYALINQILSALLPGGRGALHVTFKSKSFLYLMSRNKVADLAINLLRGRPINYPRMHMYEYSLNRVMTILYYQGCSQIFIDIGRMERTRHHNFLGAIMYFSKDLDSAT